MPRFSLALAVLAAALAGCGGEDKPSGSGKPVTVPAGEAVRVVGREYEFKPSKVVVPAGKVELTLDNQGSLAHNLKVEQGDRPIGGTTTFQGGAPRSATVTLEPGSYTMICTVGNHAQLGMRGTIQAR